MPIFQKPDGELELETSTCCCPPGPKHDGIHTRGFTFYYRINKGEWVRYQMTADVPALAEFCGTVQQFLEQLNQP